MPKAPARSRRLTAAARRAQLIEIGRKVFAERGYEATSVEEIAARAGVSKPIVYEHFGGKEGLYAVIVDREVEQIVGRIVAAISEGSPRERLERAVLAFLTYVQERPGGFAVLLRDAPESKRRGEMPALMYDLADRVGDIFTQQFAKWGSTRDRRRSTLTHSLAWWRSSASGERTAKSRRRPKRSRATSRRSPGWDFAICRGGQRWSSGAGRSWRKRLR